jgi:hypothetical protein
MRHTRPRKPSRCRPPAYPPAPPDPGIKPGGIRDRAWAPAIRHEKAIESPLPADILGRGLYDDEVEGA